MNAIYTLVPIFYYSKIVVDVSETIKDQVILEPQSFTTMKEVANVDIPLKLLLFF